MRGAEDGKLRSKGGYRNLLPVTSGYSGNVEEKEN